MEGRLGQPVHMANEGKVTGLRPPETSYLPAEEKSASQPHSVC